MEKLWSAVVVVQSCTGRKRFVRASRAVYARSGSYHANDAYRLTGNLRSRLKYALNGIDKSASTFKLVGMELGDKVIAYLYLNYHADFSNHNAYTCDDCNLVKAKSCRCKQRSLERCWNVRVAPNPIKQTLCESSETHAKYTPLTHITALRNDVETRIANINSPRSNKSLRLYKLQIQRCVQAPRTYCGCFAARA